MLTTLRRDIQRFFENDPAARSPWEIVFCYPGLHALWFYRMAHWLWARHCYFLGRLLSHLGRCVTGVEIHPGAQIGPGLVIDHGMAIVIGETAEIGSNVLLYHNVTLGGVELIKGKRHPTLEDHVVVGAGAQILGPIRIGAHSRIGANAVVVKDVPPHSVVVGVPGRTRPLHALPTGEMLTGEITPDAVHVNGHHDYQATSAPAADGTKVATVEMLQTLHGRLAMLEKELATLRAEQWDEAQELQQGYEGAYI